MKKKKRKDGVEGKTAGENRDARVDDERRLPTVFLLFFTGIATAYCLAAFFPSSLNWGFHQFAFIPLPLRIAGLACLCIPLFPHLMSRISGAAAQVVFNAIPLRIPLSITAGLLGIVLLWLLRIRMPLFGDGVYLIGAFNTMTGIEGVRESIGNAPFTGVIVYLTSRILSAVHVADAAVTALRVVSIISGIGTVMMVWVLSAHFVKSGAERVALVLLVCASGVAQLFFGYVELYTFPLFLLVVYLVAAVKTIKDDCAAVWPGVAFGLLLSSHIGMIWLLPTLLYLWWRGIKSGRMPAVLLSIAACVIVHAGLMAASGYPLDYMVAAIVHNSGERALLPVGSMVQEWQAYSLLSGWHLLDLFNLLMLIAPWSIVFIVAGVLSAGKKRMTGNVMLQFHLLLVLCATGFILLTNFRIGMSRDWDLCALFMVPICITAVYVWSNVLQSEQMRKNILVALLVLTVVPAMVLVGINAQEKYALMRYEQLPDTRVWSKEATAYFYEDLSTWFRAKKDAGKTIGYIEESLQHDPENARRWMLAMNYYLYNGEPQKSDQALLRAALSMSGSGRGVLRKAIGFYVENNVDSALVCFRQALDIEKQPAVAYFIGTILARRKADYRSALKYFNMTVRMDSTFALAYRNRGMCRMSLGDKYEMRRNFEKYFRLSPYDPQNSALKAMIVKAFARKEGGSEK